MAVRYLLVRTGPMLERARFRSRAKLLERIVLSALFMVCESIYGTVNRDVIRPDEDSKFIARRHPGERSVQAGADHRHRSRPDIVLEGLVAQVLLTER